MNGACLSDGEKKHSQTLVKLARERLQSDPFSRWKYLGSQWLGRVRIVFTSAGRDHASALGPASAVGKRGLWLSKAYSAFCFTFLYVCHSVWPLPAYWLSQ